MDRKYEITMEQSFENQLDRKKNKKLTGGKLGLIINLNF